MARYDDGKRGFGVSDAIGLSDAWQRVQMMLAAGELCFPERKPPEPMLTFFKAIYSHDGFEAALHSQMQKEDAERALISAIRSGALPVWIAPTEGAITERLVAASSLIEFGRESLIAGCYRPFNDTANLVFGYPLFVKRRDWANFLTAMRQPAEPAAPLAAKPRRKPGPAPDPDWPAAIAKVAGDCVSAGYKRPLRRGEKAAIQSMLLSEMAARDKHPSDDTALRYAAEVIAGLPER